jgi:hypothetical protein
VKLGRGTNASAVLDGRAIAICGRGMGRRKRPYSDCRVRRCRRMGLPSGKLGSTAAVEFTPIKEWLEIEAGVSTLFGGGQREWSSDLLFKKPFTLSDKVEFMFGVGPEWTFSRDGTKVAGEIAADFMFWPTPDRKLGWFFDPSYSYSLSNKHEQSLGASAGVLIPIP